MRVEFRPEGIYLPDIELWLDPSIPVPVAWLSHAHSDHARELHGIAIATRITGAIYRHRWPLLNGEIQDLRVLDPGQSMDWRGARLTAFPAAHILGAAQLLVEHSGERLLYTGDIKARPPICGWETEMPVCDRLIIESTFGLPIYHFLEAEDAKARMIAFANETLDKGLIPVFQGYSLGRGQEIVHSLAMGGVKTRVHGAIAALLPYYEAEGYASPEWMGFEGTQAERAAWIVTPAMRDLLPDRSRVALVSGWAAVDSSRGRSGADVLIPYSDHGGFEELLGLVKASGARKIDVVHGYAEAFAGILRARGYEACAATAVQPVEEERAL